MEKKKLFTNRDFVYWIGFLLFIIILSWTIRIQTTDVLLDKISFAVGIASLILAGVAIIYSFVQSIDSSSQSRLINQALIDVTNKINELNKVTDSLSDIKDELSELKTHTKTDTTTIIEAISNLKEEVGNIDISKILDKKSIKITPDVEAAIEQEFKKEINKGISKFEDTMFRIDNEIEAALAEYLSDLEMGSSFVRKNFKKYLVDNNLHATEDSVEQAIKKFRRIGAMKISTKVFSSGRKVAILVKSGDFEKMKKN